jgi:hypothetical protein
MAREKHCKLIVDDGIGVVDYVLSVDMIASGSGGVEAAFRDFFNCLFQKIPKNTPRLGDTCTTLASQT